MTFSAKRAERNPEHIDVTVTYGPIVFNVREHMGHLRSFWHDLGQLLAQVEQKPEGD